MASEDILEEDQNAHSPQLAAASYLLHLLHHRIKTYLCLAIGNA